MSPKTLLIPCDRVNGEEDARVCKDIPEDACHDQPRNFCAYLTANLLGKIADEVGGAILGMLVSFSPARGLCSVSAKDVPGKTVSKSRRGALTGWSASLSGVAVLGIGLWLGTLDLAASGPEIFAGLLTGGAVLWLLAALARLEDGRGGA